MRAYYVHIVAEDAQGNKIRFDEVVRYPNRSYQAREYERERDGIKQVEARMPHLRDVRAEGSIHT